MWFGDLLTPCLANLDEKYRHLVMIAHTQGTVTTEDLKSSKILKVPELHLKSQKWLEKVVEFLQCPRYFDENKGKEVTTKGSYVSIMAVP